MHANSGMRCALVFACAAALAAQESRFDVRSRLVLVPVNVTDQKGRSVDGLGISDFLVFDNGQPRKAAVDTIDTGVAPIALVIAVQSSGISAPTLEKVRTIGAMIQPLVTGERGCAGLAAFAERVEWLQDCTKDADALSAAFRKLEPLLRPGEEKRACMLDAVGSAVEHLRRRENARRVLLLISESRDRGSEADLAAVAASAQSAGVAIYSATYSAFKAAFTSKSPVGPPRRPLKPKTPIGETGTPNGRPPGMHNPYPKIPPPEQQVDILAAMGELVRLGQTNTTQALAKATGGAIFPFTTQRALEEVVHKLGGDLHSQYVISFVPDAASSPGYHQLEVRLARPGDFRIRARPGYWLGEDAQ